MKTRTIRLALGLAVVLSAPLAAQKPVKLLTAQQLQAIDGKIEQARQQWGLPGMSVAIVQGDSVMMARGYGVRELGKPERVDENTLFAIGSSGKSMTAALISMLVDDGKMRFDDPMWTYLPRFRVADPYVSREATIRDILSHRSGIEDVGGAWYGSAETRAQIIERFRFLKQAAGFRTRLVYNNLLLMAAGEAAAAAAGKSWEDLTRERLFQPLGMTSSLTNPEELRPNANAVSPHMMMNGKLIPIDHRATRNIGPAGAQYSTARDMAQYLRLQLGNGKYNGKQLISPASMTQMRAVVISSGAPVIMSDTAVTALGYGMGWFNEYYRGRRLLRHGGAIDGMLTEMMFLPEEQIGVVILTNQSPHTMHTALTNHIFDIALGLPERDWNGIAFARTQAQSARAAEALKAQVRPPNAQMSLPLSAYAGTYSDSLQGDIRLVMENNGLVLYYHPTLVADLEPWQFNSFRLVWRKMNSFYSPSAFVSFMVDHTGKPTELRLPSFGTFRPVANRPGGAAPAPAPATPARDYSAPADAPYTAESVTVTTPMGHTLAGTLTLPKGARRGSIPAVVTISGSGPQDRDVNILLKNYRPFRQLADSLGRRGIAVLRMDDRGTGESKGTFKGSTSADFAEDIRAGLAYLRTRPEIDANRLGLIGHSEGGLIAPMVALKEPSLKGIVLLAGPSQSGRTILSYQMRNNITNNKALSAAGRDSLLARIPVLVDSLGARDPWMGYFLAHDPIATAKQVKTPVLILTGGTDQQVTPVQVAELEAAFKAGGNRDITARVIPNLNHLFIYDTDGFPGNYTKLTREYMEPEVVGAVADWLVSRLRR